MEIRKNDVAIVTGASRGLGVYIARALAAKGTRLVLAARTADGLESVAAELRKSGTEVLCVPTDVADASALQALVDATLARFGRIDILVNNAGYDDPMSFDQCGVDDIRAMVAINLSAPMILSRLVIPAMQKAGRGHIVNIASLAGVMPVSYEELYCATKHGLVGFTRSLRSSAQDMKWPLSASVICPGFMADAGVYVEMVREYKVTAPGWIGAIPAPKLGRAVVRAIEKDLPDVIMMRGTPRLFVATIALMPRIYEIVSAMLNPFALFRAVAKAKAAERK
ncbi:MAG TPA: SDR family NAD(P)-dependent oxidoreductase [Rhizomicrobium sp.]|nr:SDR family NAD(P)-dependent oxidoreductase [Rhizomicrobium sp.]